MAAEFHCQFLHPTGADLSCRFLPLLKAESDSANTQDRNFTLARDYARRSLEGRETLFEALSIKLQQRFTPTFFALLTVNLSAYFPVQLNRFGIDLFQGCVLAAVNKFFYSLCE
jgi:hypothetical protein